MPSKPCMHRDCRVLLLRGSWCKKHKPVTSKRWAGGSTRAWRKQRERILERDGFRCTAILNGKRCTARATEVHHLRPGNQRVVADSDLVSVCRKHNPRGARAA